MRRFENLKLASGLILGLLILASCGDDEDPEPANPLSISDFSVTIDENPERGQSLGTVNASSSGGESFTWSLSSEMPSGALALGSDGELTVNDSALFDFEVNPTISAVATITSGEFSQRADITILLTNVFEGTIWSGETIAFSKSDGTDPTDQNNQDRITSKVWITRGNDGGQIYNAASEDFAAQASSPEGTEWAVGTTAEILDLVFQPFRAAVGSPKDVVGKSLVLRLVEEDIYLDVEFTQWSQGMNGGFSWERSSPNE